MAVRIFFNYTEVGVINTNCFSVSNISTLSLLYLNDYDWTGYDILKNKCCKILKKKNSPCSPKHCVRIDQTSINVK